MRYTFALFTCVALLTPALAEDPQYLDDAQIKALIEHKGTVLIEAGETVENATLQEQLKQATVYDAAPPVQGQLVEGGEGLYDAADDGVIVVTGLYLCGRCDKFHANCASGFVISEDGLAVTNYHVIEGNTNTTMVAMTRDGRVVPILEVLAANKADDTAMIRLGKAEDRPFTPVPLARSARVGERVHAITHPTGRFYFYASGEISRFFMQRRARNQPPIRRVSITAEYAKGSSGGPIFNDAGQVVAMVCSTNSVYYNQQNGDPRNLQLVFRDCVPYESILELFAKDDAGNLRQADAE
ncbi:MAG: serine protease [Planctomycetota bacterium]